MAPESFAELIKTAAANHDQRQKTLPASNPSSTYFTKRDEKIAATPYASTLVAHFFSKTPPPPHFKRPWKYRRQNQYRRDNDRRLPRRLLQCNNRGRRERRCYGCNQVGHYIRNCPHRDRYYSRLQHVRNLGTGAVMLIEALETDAEQTDELDEVYTYLTENGDLNHEDTSEFDSWVCDLLDIIDDQNSSPVLVVKESLDQLQEAAHAFGVLHIDNVQKHFLLDTGAPKNICSRSWLSSASCTPVHTATLPINMQPFRFAGTSVSAENLVCLIAEVQSISGQKYIFRIVTFVLPPLPILFLVGLQTARDLSFDLCLRKQNSSHLRINNWNQTFPLAVNSHVWLKFSPINEDPDSSFDWKPLISRAIQVHSPDTHIVELDITGQPTSKAAAIPDPPAHHVALITPPWEKDEWRSKTSAEHIDHLHNTLKHPTRSAMLDLFRRLNSGRRLPKLIQDRINHKSENCRPCKEHAELPRVPKISTPPPATPNIAVSLDVMHHRIRGTSHNILVMLDSGDCMLRLSHLHDASARTAFNAYFARWISIFDAPVYTIVDRGTNLACEDMKQALRAQQSQLCPIPTEAPWCIGANERSHRFLHKVMDKLMSTPDYEPGPHLELLLGETEILWNFHQHSNLEIPHFNRFGIMPRALGELETPPTIQERVAIRESLRNEINRLRIDTMLGKAFSQFRRHVREHISFNIGQDVWFHRKRHGWRQGTVAQIDRPTIIVSHDNKLFPTHERRIRPYHGTLSLPPEIIDNDEDEYISPEHIQPNGSTHHQGASVARLINPIFFVSPAIQPNPHPTLSAATSGSSITLRNVDFLHGAIDSDSMEIMDEELYSEATTSQHCTHLTTQDFIKSTAKLPKADQDKFQVAKQDEIQFLLEHTVKPIHRKDVPDECEIQSLRWILSIKKSSTETRHRARLITGSHKSIFRHSISGNAPTIALSSLRTLLSITPTWNAIEPTDILVRDVTKAYLQSMPTKRLLFYQPPKEFYENHPDRENLLWKAITQIYGDVEAGKYWYHTFVPWFRQNFMDYKQSLYDPSLLHSKASNSATALCTDDCLTVIPQRLAQVEKKIANRFPSRNAKAPPTDFKGIDIQ